MLPNIHTFLFSPPRNISPLTARRVHLRRLYDVLHICIQRGDIYRSRRAWAILARCKEIDWKISWALAIGLLGYARHPLESTQMKINYLRTMMLHLSEDRETILCELVHLYALTGRHKEALDELEFSLASFPFRDNVVLHIYAGICSVLASQPDAAINGQLVDSEMLGRAQISFERAKSLDPGNIVVDSLLGMTQNLAQIPATVSQTESSDDEADQQFITTEYVPVKRLRA